MYVGVVTYFGILIPNLVVETFSECVNYACIFGLLSYLGRNVTVSVHVHGHCDNFQGDVVTTCVYLCQVTCSTCMWWH